MQQRNPYQAPTAAVEDRRPDLPAGALEYAGFWRRFAAFWIDALIFLPASGMYYLFSDKSRMFLAYWFVPGLALGLLFNVYLVRRYGGTPGKLIMKTRIALVDGSPVTTRAAFLRHAVLFALGALSSLGLLMGSLQMSDDLYGSLGYIARTKMLTDLAPPWYLVVTILIQLWVWGEFVTMLFNKRRRAVHDFMAGTVVVRNGPVG